MIHFDKYGNNINLTARINDPNIKIVLAQIQDKTAKDGIISLLEEEHTFHAFERALETLSVAKKTDLRTIEALLQYTITEIKRIDKSNTNHWNDKKTSLYLYTLQYVISHLNIFKVSDGTNEYRSQLALKVEEATDLCKQLKVDINIMRKKCINTSYQQPNIKELREFKLIDAESLDIFIKQLKKYSITRKETDLNNIYNINDRLPLSSQIDPIIQKLITHMEKKIGIQKLDLQSYQKNCGTIINEINNLFSKTDPELVQYVAEALRKKLENDAKINEPDGGRETI